MGNNTISNNTFVPPVSVDSVAPSRMPGEEQRGFGAVLRDAVDRVQELHTNAQVQIGDLLKGDQSDIQNVMIAVEKADVAFQLMMQVRNKIVNAYEEISRMQF